MSNKYIRKALEAKKFYDQAIKQAKSGNFAYKLAAKSFESHLNELSQIELTSKINPAYEMLDFRVKATHLKTGNAPLDLVAKLTNEIRKTIGYAALRLMKGGINKKRIPKYLFQDLDLRLEGILPGSSRFIISAAAKRDLFDDGLSKGAIERVFSVLSSLGQGEEFLSSINDLGPSGAKSLRELLKLMKHHDAELELTWKYSGEEVKKWKGSKKDIESVTSSLEVTEITEQEKIVLHGTIELLSKRERIDLRINDNKLIKVLYPKSALSMVSELHLEQEVSLYCQVTETENPLTNESSIFYELLEIR
ncbi:hypothetical protein [Sulfurimonas marina]|uniref:Uncharacterized protein n=1 Tax=Sulfurimonas marina TaxID=2590551 RepID=A0A7M1ATM3_9BACT|nr:hypothetical protein [Sulfurimonas marina]QOP40764.1 hypothetical protein FJR03_03010 [Sulfurimonas marina]